jgi:DNA-binding response OmpR family regulator/two-component sensor histidine kinase
LVADDNADMRRYVVRLLSDRYRVEAVADGAAALESVRGRPPDLILTDVMMPRLDGSGLLRELRSDPRTAGVPVIVLSARAGEESRVEGMQAGGDDYLVKPFGARELLARVGGLLQIARLRREAGESLRAQQEELREAQRVAHVGSWRWDAGTDVTTDSDELYRIFGLDPEAQPFPDFADQNGLLYPHGEWRRLNEAVRETLRTGVGYELDVQALRNGEPIWITTRGEVVRDAGGEVLGLRGTVQDITDRKRVAPIRNGLQIMKLAGGDGRAVEGSRAMMERQVEQMARLIEDLMDVSRISRGKIVLQKRRMRLAQAVGDAIETSRPLIERQGHEFTPSVTDEPIFVDGDATRLCQVFANLLNNAAKYTDPGGRIGLTVERQGCDAVVGVVDSGVGIPAHMLTKVFDLFSQVDRSLENSEGGLGIGLNLVKRLVEMHGGTITAESGGYGMGSTFTVRLPVVPSVTTDLPDADGGGTATPTARRRILVVDDNRDSADSLATLLRLTGHEVQTAYDGDEGVEAAERVRPEVLLLDLGMPILNGYDACRRIRKQAWGNGVVLIAMAGWGQVEDRRRTAEAGFDAHIVKPVNPHALMKLLAELNVAKV